MSAVYPAATINMPEITVSGNISKPNLEHVAGGIAWQALTVPLVIPAQEFRMPMHRRDIRPLVYPSDYWDLVSFTPTCSGSTLVLKSKLTTIGMIGNASFYYTPDHTDPSTTVLKTATQTIENGYLTMTIIVAVDGNKRLIAAVDIKLHVKFIETITIIELDNYFLQDRFNVYDIFVAQSQPVCGLQEEKEFVVSKPLRLEILDQIPGILTIGNITGDPAVSLPPPPGYDNVIRAYGQYSEDRMYVVPTTYQMQGKGNGGAGGNATTYHSKDIIPAEPLGVTADVLASIELAAASWSTSGPARIKSAC